MRIEGGQCERCLLVCLDLNPKFRSAARFPQVVLACATGYHSPFAGSPLHDHLHLGFGDTRETDGAQVTRHLPIRSTSRNGITDGPHTPRIVPTMEGMRT